MGPASFGVQKSQTQCDTDSTLPAFRQWFTCTFENVHVKHCLNVGIWTHKLRSLPPHLCPQRPHILQAKNDIACLRPLEPARCEITAKRDAHLSNPPTQGLFYFNWDITWRRSTGINSPPSTFGMLIISPRIWNCVCKQALVDVSLGLLTFLHSLSFSKLGASPRLKNVGVSAKTSKFHLRGAESTF